MSVKVPEKHGDSRSQAATATDLAKAALRRLSREQLEATPANYARAYAQELGQSPASPPSASASAKPASGSGSAPDDGKTVLNGHLLAWVALTERLARNLERGGRQWTAARRKDSLRRVFDGSRNDPARLHQRLVPLMKAWEDDLPADDLELGEGFEAIVAPTQALATSLPLAPAETGGSAVVPAAAIAGAKNAGDSRAWSPVLMQLQQTVALALPPAEPAALQLAQRLNDAARDLAEQGLSPARVAQVAQLCEQARGLLGQRHRLVRQLSTLCQDLGAGLGEVAEDQSWVQGQCQLLQECLGDDGQAEPSLRKLRDAADLLADTRRQQESLRGQRQAAQTALKSLIRNMLLEVGELGDQTGRFQVATEAHAQAIAEAQSLEGLTDVVKSLIEDSRAVQAAVSRSQQKLHLDRDRATELESRVRELEGELRQLSQEVSTDALTQVANRRGLAQAFAQEAAAQERLLTAAARGGATPAPLVVCLMDIDNFKKLNDSLGHAAGDVALKSLATQVQSRLRPADHLARFGGEEFVVLLPATPLGEAQQAMTRLQRSLSVALFLHEGREVFVTFSAGVTSWQQGETLESALERADAALYEAKRTGKNKTCQA